MRECSTRVPRSVLQPRAVECTPWVVRALQVANWIVAFVVEMWMLWAYAEWGYRSSSAPALRWVLALAAPSAAALVWGRWAAPKALTRLGPPWLWALEWSMFALAAAAIHSVGRTRLAISYLIIASLSLVLSAYFHDPVAPRP